MTRSETGRHDDPEWVGKVKVGRRQGWWRHRQSPEEFAERQALKRARHRRRRSKLYRTWLASVRSGGEPGLALHYAKRVEADRRRRRARRAARQALR